MVAINRDVQSDIFPSHNCPRWRDINDLKIHIQEGHIVLMAFGYNRIREINRDFFVNIVFTPGSQ